MYVVLPDKVMEELKKRAELEAKTVEEVVADAALQLVGAMDPSLKVELHVMLRDKYLIDAERFLKEGDGVQASEKAWGAASQAVKAIAAKEGMDIRSHRELHRYVAKLVERSRDPEVGRLWRSAGFLHVNFYENWLPLEQVRDGLNDVKKLVEMLRPML